MKLISMEIEIGFLISVEAIKKTSHEEDKPPSKRGVTLGERV